MRKIIELKEKVYFFSNASCGGYEERMGPRGEKFDFCDESELFGQKSFEDAESEMSRICMNLALKKGGISSDTLDVVMAGDLENQCVASANGLYTFGIPYVGLYSACSTCTEALLLTSILLSFTNLNYGATVTTSHNSTAEKQFRTPLEYGSQRSPTAQWTATAGAAFILTTQKFKDKNVYIDNVMLGKTVDGLTADASCMGPAMARAAFDSIYTYFSLSKKPLSSFDLIITGDLGFVGSDILKELLSVHLPGSEQIHVDCGTLLYSKNKKNLNAGASGCGCSAALLSTEFLPLLKEKKLNNVLFLSTGALMNSTSVMRGNNILGIAPIINICTEQ